MVAVCAWSQQSEGLNYTIRAVWDDPTPPGSNYAPAYDVRWRVNGGEVQEQLGADAPEVMMNVAAVAGANIDVSVRARNTLGGDTPGNWSAWQLVTSPVKPNDQINIRITVTVIQTQP